MESDKSSSLSKADQPWRFFHTLFGTFKDVLKMWRILEKFYMTHTGAKESFFVYKFKNVKSLKNLNFRPKIMISKAFSVLILRENWNI